MKMKWCKKLWSCLNSKENSLVLLNFFLYYTPDFPSVLSVTGLPWNLKQHGLETSAGIPNIATKKM